MTNSTPTFLVLSETTLPRLLWLAARSHPGCVIEVEPLTYVGRALLPWVLDKLRDHGRALCMERDRPELVPYTDINDVHRYTDTFRRTEPWQAEYFRYAEADRILGDYAYPYKDICGNYLQRKFLLLFKLRRLAELGAVVYGVGKDTIALNRARFGDPPPLFWRPAVKLGWLLNTLTGFSVLAFTLLWLTSRLRPNQRIEGHYFLGSDYVEDSRDEILWRELDDAPRPIMVVFRNRQQAPRYHARAATQDSCYSGDGLMPIGKGLAAMAQAAADIVRLWAWGCGLAPDHFRMLVLLPFRRMMFRALFSRFRFDYFWGRDDYNVEHILRSQELRRVGGRSHGTSHGFHVVSSVLQQTRYVDYDLYYVFGEQLCRRHIGATWPKHMHLRNVSSFALDRTELWRLKNERPPDICCILVPSKGSRATFAELVELAKLFPDRRIYLNVKEKYRTGDYADMLDRFLAQAPANIVEYRTDVPGRSVYDLLYMTRYMVSEPTTLVTEAIHFGLYAFVFDLDPKWVTLTFREFPDLCVKRAEQAATRIRGIESGKWGYPRHLYAGDVDLTGRPVWDIIRAGFGLPPREAPLPHLAFVSST